MSIEAEQAVLGGLLLDPTAWDRIAGAISAADFANRNHRLIFEAIAALASGGTAADVVTVEDLLKHSGELDATGGLPYLAQLANNTPSAANIAAYARIVADASLERRLVAAAGKIAELAKGNGPVREKLDQAQALLSVLAVQDRAGGPILASLLLPTVLNEIERRHQSGSALLGLATGFTDLDQMTLGLQAGELVIIAGRPSSGKTTLAMNIAEHVAVHEGRTAVVFSLEMPSNQLLLRSMASLERLDFQRVRSARLHDDEWPKLSNAASKLGQARLLIDDAASIGVNDLRAKARKVMRDHGLGLVVVDYLQLMQGEGQNRNLEVAHISAGLKSLAKELNVPVIALSQLNRDVARGGRRPRLSDLRDSGSLEQDADVVFFVHRQNDDDQDGETSGIAEVIIGKQRNGPHGTVHLVFNGANVRFDNYAGPPITGNTVRQREWSGGFVC